MRSFRSQVSSIVLICACAMPVGAASAQPITNRLSLRPETEATNLLAGFRLHQGFRIEVAAAEPMVSTPAALAFDENSRLYVAELSNLPGEPQTVPSPGRIRLLDDPDGQGRYRISTLFADDVAWPSALACYDGGVFVASVSDVLFLKDTNGDGVADVRRVVLTGFGGTNTPHISRLLNSFNWGLDCRIHGAAAGIGGSILSTAPGAREPVSIEDSDFSFDPRSLTVIPETGPAETGLSFDTTGRKFVTGFSHPLQLVMGESRYWRRNPFYVRANPLTDVLSPATTVYRFGRGTDTNLESVTKPLEIGGLSSTWLRAARGLSIYRGGIFPQEFADNAFVCDPEAHIVHRVVLQENGIAVEGTRSPDEARTEFLLSTNSAFHPVQAVNGPEGALYIADAQEGERGRIYRVVPKVFKHSQRLELGKAKTYDLVAALANPNGWCRDTALRLLYQERDASALPLLSNMLYSAQLPIARIYALHALAATGLLRESHVLKALRDNDPRVRQHGLLAAEVLRVNGAATQATWNQMRLLATDPSPVVRYQLAFTAGAFPREDKVLLLAQVLSRAADNPWVQDAVMSSLNDGAGTLFVILAGDRRVLAAPSGFLFLRRLTSMIGVKGRLDDVNQVLEFLSHKQMDPIQAFNLIDALGDGLHRTRSSLALVDPQATLQTWYSAALLAAVDVAIPEGVRVEAVKMLAVSPYTYSETSDWLLVLANPDPLAALRSAAVSTLTRYDDPRVLPALLDRWPGFPAQLRRLATEGLLSRANRVPAVLNALERRAIPVGDLFTPTLNFLLTYPDPGVRQVADKLLAPVALEHKQAAASLESALQLPGVAARGQEVFRMRCAECHQMRSSADRFSGPSLIGAKVKGRRGLLSAVLRPSLEIRPRFRTWLLETEEGEQYAGVKADENPVSVTLLRAGPDAAVWHRTTLRGLHPETWSLMPDAVDLGLSPQDLADLLEYLMTARD